MREGKEEKEGEKEGKWEEVKKKERKLFSIIYLKCQGYIITEVLKSVSFG